MISKTNISPSLSNSIKNPTISYIKWCSISSPRPFIGIPGVLYINESKRMISIWNDVTKKYVDFCGVDKNKSITNDTTNKPIEIVESNNKSDNLYSFNLIDDTLSITDSTSGVVLEIPIPNKNVIDEKIKTLEERISKLEELF